jgi:RNA polymerase sigma-70 factor (ECF subfamily)
MSSSNLPRLLFAQYARVRGACHDTVEVQDSVGPRLDEIIRSARVAWPTVKLSPEQFVSHLARHIPANDPIDSTLARMHTDDLYLACACALGEKGAIFSFEQHCLADLERTLRRYRGSSDLVPEVKQRVRDRALVGHSGPPKIYSYSGRSDLRSWVRVIAIREAIDMVRRSRREIPLDDDVPLHGFVTPGDAELEHLKRHYSEEFKRAFSAALRGLSVRDQTMLRQHIIDGLSIDQLGALYRMHRATAARNLQRARRALLDATREQLASRLEVGPHELDSILHLVRSRLEVTLRWLVRPRRN